MCCLRFPFMVYPSLSTNQVGLDTRTARDQSTEKEAPEAVIFRTTLSSAQTIESEGLVQKQRAEKKKAKRETRRQTRKKKLGFNVEHPNKIKYIDDTTQLSGLVT
ncbi:hypothetical protein MRB53_018973 [Persea americana]|uniref:Uncharacterized protein n=1 Tax=Persea americana TaxID=3435 RepID=A0ACC2M993_PERAE|nr:hypothetical protein MRB53_018973 [Persea americana]